MTKPHVAAILALHQDAIVTWKSTNIELKEHDFLKIVEANHTFNFQLWETEDRARRDDLGYEFVYRAKREIDRFNQQRNDCVEAMDTWLVNALKPSLAKTCPVHSETPGMMIDRLSILALKEYHMTQQIYRTDVDDEHRARCRQKVSVICAQKDQLAHCLDALLDEVLTQKRTFVTYYQFKMYNDPAMQPVLEAEMD